MVFALLTLAAQQATVTGVVRDSASLEPIAFAEVAVSPTVSTVRSAAGFSDRFGAFAIPNTPVGPVRIEANAFGYTRWTRHFEEFPAGPVEILLAPAPIALDPLSVGAAARAGDPISVSRDAFVVDVAMIRAMPTVLETDVLRAMAVSPSASAPSDFVSVPYVRGGAGEGTPVLLDGVRLFNPFHLGGFFSAVNPEAVDHAALLPGSGAGSQHIGSLSGAIEITTRDGSRDGHRVAGAVGLASSRLAVEGPVGDRTSYLVDGRHTYVDLLAKALGADFPYSFSDVHGKITHDFGGPGRLSVSGYVNSEAMEYDDHWSGGRTDFGWGSSAFSAHYRDRLAGGVLLDVIIGHSRFGNDLLELGESWGHPVADTLVSGGGHMKEDRVDLRARWHLSGGTVTAGAQAIRLEGDHDYSRSDAGDFVSLFIPAPLTVRARQWRIGTFANVDAPMGPNWRTRAGVRLDRFSGLANTFAPFAEVSYAGPWWEARIAVARSYQALASLRNEESFGASLFAYDLFVPVGDGSVPRNTEITAGWEGSRGEWRLRLDGYARRMGNIRLPVLGEAPIEEAVLGDPSFRMVGGGTARGIEASFSWARGPFSTVGSYSWSRATRTVEDMTYVPRFHRDHEIELGAALETGRSTWSARFSARSGQPTTPALAFIPVGRHDMGEGDETRWVWFDGAYNSERLRPYLRVDLGWRRTRRPSQAGDRFVTPFVSVTNLLSAPNVAAGWAEANPDFEGREVTVERQYFPQVPMLVFFGVEFGF